MAWSAEPESRAPLSFPQRGKVPSAHTGRMREKLSVRHTNGSKSLTKPSPSSVIRLAGDGGCHLPPLGEGKESLLPIPHPLLPYSLFTISLSHVIIIEHVCGSGPVLPLFLWYFPVLSFGAGFWRAAPLSEITSRIHIRTRLWTDGSGASAGETGPRRASVRPILSCAFGHIHGALSAKERSQST